MTLAAALGALAAGARVDVTPSAIEEALAMGAVRGASEAWASDIARTAVALDLRVRVIEASVRALQTYEASGLLPLVRVERAPTAVRLDPAGGRAGDGGPCCVAIVEVLRGRFVVVVTDAIEEVRYSLNAFELAALLGIDADTKLTWLNAEPARSVEGTGAHQGPARRLLSIANLERDDVGVVCAYAVAVGLLSLATPLGVQFLVNTVAFGAMLQPLVVLALLVLAGLSLEGLLRALQYWVVERIQQRLFVRVALDVAYRLPHVQARVFDRHNGPELVNRFFDVTALQKGAATLLSDGVSIVLHSLMGMLILAFYHPFLLGFDVLMLVAIAVVIFAFGRGATPTALSESKAKYAVAAWLEDAARHRASLALGDGPAFVAARAESLARTWLDGRRRHWRVVFRQIASALALQAIASAALLGIGGALVLGRQLTLGQLVAAELIVTTVVASFAKLGKSFESYYDLLAATDKLGHLTGLEREHTRGAPLPDREGGLDVVLDRVDLGRGERVVARGVDLHLRPGSRTVVIARSGGGKSTLADVVAGARGAAGGRILVDGIPTEDLSAKALGGAAALVRHAEIFGGTLFENIAMGRRDVGRTEVRDALAALGLDTFVAQLPGGLDTHLSSETTLLGDAGALLVTLARTLVGAPRLVVLDGALDTFDDETRQAVWSALASQPWTLLVTTSRRDLLDLGETAFTLDSGGLARTRGHSRFAASEHA